MLPRVLRRSHLNPPLRPVAPQASPAWLGPHFVDTPVLPSPYPFSRHQLLKGHFVTKCSLVPLNQHRTVSPNPWLSEQLL